MTGEEGVRIRVWVADVWDVVELTCRPDQTLADVKAICLERATGRSVDPDRYHLKFRGALVLDESQTVAAAEVPDGAPLIVLPAQRQPVR